MAAPRLDSLTALRWFAALAVFGRHALPRDGAWARFTPQGATAVSFFFILSGFVLAWSHRPGDRPAAFYRRRAARIYPAYLAAVVIGLCVAEATGDLPTIGQVIPVALLVQGWVPSHEVYYAVGAPLWSLSTEAFFYLIFPLVIGGLVRLGGRGRSLLMVALVGVAILLPVVVHPRGAFGTGFWLIYIFPLARLPEFLLGILIALAVRDGSRLPIGLAPALLITVAGYLAAGWVPRHLMWVATTIVPFAVLVAAAATADLERRRSWLRAAPLVRLGAWSFAFYLLHAYVLYLRFVYVRSDSLLVTAVAPLFVSLAAAAALYHFVERPFEARLRGSARRVPEPRRVA